jgi:hypothetical protein
MVRRGARHARRRVVGAGTRTRTRIKTRKIRTVLDGDNQEEVHKKTV